MLNSKPKKIKEMYETNYTQNKLNLYNYIDTYTNLNNILFYKFGLC